MDLGHGWTASGDKMGEASQAHMDGTRRVMVLQTLITTDHVA